MPRLAAMSPPTVPGKAGAVQLQLCDCRSVASATVCGATVPSLLRHLLGCCHMCYTAERALSEWVWSAWQPVAPEHGL